MKPKYQAILETAIHVGISRGIARSRKHTDTPSDEVLEDNIDRAIWEEINSVFYFDNPESE